MKIYLVKRSEALILNGLNGLHQAPYNDNYTQILINDPYDLNNKLAVQKKISSLPKNCDIRLVCSFLMQMQQGNTTFESVKLLKKYLECAEKKDSNDAESHIMRRIKKVVFGVFYLMSGIGGFLLMTLLIGLLPAYGSWISCLIVSVGAVTFYGITNSLIGIFQLAVKILSCCFQQKSTDNDSVQLRLLEEALRHSCLEFSSLPPSYHEQVNHTMHPISAELDPPTYEQAMSMYTETSPSNTPIQQSFSSRYSPNFYHSFPSSNYSKVNEDLPPAYCTVSLREG